MNRAEIVTSRGGLAVAEIHIGGLPRGAAIVLCDMGDFERHAPEALDHLATAGYETVAVDLSSPSAPEGSPGRDLSDADLLADLDALLQRHADRGWSRDQIGLVGFGLGGRVALAAAASDLGVGAAVSLSVAGFTTPLVDGLPALAVTITAVRTPWLGIFGERDDSAPGDVVDQFDRRLRDRSPVYCQIVRYPGVDAAFYRGSPSALSLDAAFDAWQRTIEWFERRVVPRDSPRTEAWLAGRGGGITGR